MKKVLIALLSICCLFFNVFTVSAHDNPDTGITPYAASIPCPECIFGVAVRTSTIYKRVLHFVSRQCTHGKSGTDSYAYVVREHRYVCGSCGYYEQADIVSEGLEFQNCNGY